MLYEPSKTKRYILIGAIAVVLAFLVVVIAPLVYKQKTSKPPANNLSSQEKTQQEKIQKEQAKLIEMAKNQKGSLLSPEQLQKDMDRLIEEAKTNKTLKSPEELQKDQNSLIKATKK